MTSYDNIRQPAEIEPEGMLAGIIDWVGHETPSDRHDLIDLLYDHIEESFEGLPVKRERLPAQGEGAGQLVLTYAPEGARGKPAAAFGHIDTVWDTGTLAERPVRREGDKVFGPGIYDMKAGSYLVTEAMRRIARDGLVPPAPIVIFLNGDEEIGSPASRGAIEAIGREAAFSLIPEPAFEAPGTLITARKGFAFFDFVAHGVSAHAGGSLPEGRSALRELAYQLIEIEAMNATEPRASFNVGVMNGGTRRNVVPARASMQLDMRTLDVATAERLLGQIMARKPITPDVRLEITGEINRPTFERTPAVAHLYERTVALGRALGLELAETSRGGASDGNFLAALGLPVLDGFGLNGAGAHALHEHVLVSGIAPRAALIHSMFMSDTFRAEVLAPPPL